MDRATSNRTTYVNRLTYGWKRTGFLISDPKYSNDRGSRTHKPPGNRSALIHDDKARNPSRGARYCVSRAPAIVTTSNWAFVAWVTRNASCSGNVMMCPSPYVTAHCVRRGSTALTKRGSGGRTSRSETRPTLASLDSPRGSQRTTRDISRCWHRRP